MSVPLTFSDPMQDYKLTVQIPHDSAPRYKADRLLKYYTNPPTFTNTPLKHPEKVG